MIKYLIAIASFISVNTCKSQKIEIVPNLGIQYYGISYISKNDVHPMDFRASRPNIEGTWGFSVKYKRERLRHILSLQDIVLGSSFSFRNIYLDKGIIPTFQERMHSDGIDVLLFSYNIQKEFNKEFIFFGKSKLKFIYSGGVGIAFNRSKWFYDIVLPPYSFGQIISTNYFEYHILYNRAGAGVFLIGKAGFNFYNKKGKNFLTLEAFWNQGLKKMEEFSIDYNYGYLNTQYQRTVKDVKLKSRGTAFGFTLGVPIRLINDKKKIK